MDKLLIPSARIWLRISEEVRVDSAMAITLLFNISAFVVPFFPLIIISDSPPISFISRLSLVFSTSSPRILDEAFLSGVGSYLKQSGRGFGRAEGEVILVGVGEGAKGGSLAG